MPSTLRYQGARLIDAAEVTALQKCLTTSLNQTTGTIPANIINGGEVVVCIQTNSTPGTQTTRTAAQLYADDPVAWIGGGYLLRVANNSGSGTMTLAGGTGVTVTGTATIANGVFRDYLVTYGGTDAAPTVTFTNVGSGTYP